MYEVDFHQLLSNSPRPYHTLAQAFAATTGHGIDTRLVQKLLQANEPTSVLDAIEKLKNRQVDNPVKYLIGILRNKNKEKTAGKKRESKFQQAIDLLSQETTEKLLIRSPFDEGTAE